MTVRKRKSGGFEVAHCHGADAGKPITKKRLTKEQAEKVHRVIQANKKK